MKGLFTSEGNGESDPEISVLHVDDEPGLAETTAAFLEREDERLSVKTATDTREALEQLNEDVDCIVSDYDMPGMDGIEFLATVREKHPKLPFILFTGKGSEAVASEAISAGVTDYLQKGTGTEQYELLRNRIGNAVERYRNERRLRQSQRRFERVFEQSNDAIMILDPKRDAIRSVNERAVEMLGYEREELLSMSPADIHPREVEQFREFVDAVYEGGTEWTEELSCRKKDGTHLDVHVSASTVEMDDSPHMLALIRDIGDRADGGDAELFRTLLDHSTDGIYVVDPDGGEFVDVNDTACQRLGYEREELLSMSVPDIDAVGSARDWDDHVERVLTTERLREGTVHRRKDGTTYPVEIRAEHVVVNDDENYMIAVARDITDERAHEQTIETLNSTATALRNVETPEAVAERVVEAGRDTLDIPVNAVWLLAGDRLEPAAWTDDATEVVGQIPTFDRGEGLAWDAFEAGTTRYYEDVSAVDGRYNPETAVRSEILLPLGEHGVMAIGSRRVDAFGDTEVSLAEILTKHAATALDRIDER